MEPHLNQVEEVLSPGFTIHTWTSLNIQLFIESIHRALSDLELLVDKVVGIKENRIQLALEGVTLLDICGLPPNGEVCTIQEFLSATKVRMYVHTYIHTISYIHISICTYIRR